MSTLPNQQGPEYQNNCKLQKKKRILVQDTYKNNHSQCWQECGTRLAHLLKDHKGLQALWMRVWQFEKLNIGSSY